MRIEQHLASLHLQPSSENMSSIQNTTSSATTQTYTVEADHASTAGGDQQQRGSSNISVSASYPRTSQQIQAPWEQHIYTSASHNTSSLSYFMGPQHQYRSRGINAPNGLHHASGIPMLTSMSRYTTSAAGGMDSEPQSTRPHFRSKVVCVINCKHCGIEMCQRGMKAILLADMNVELYSTDFPPYSVQLVNDDYRTKNCACRIRDVACLGCGNVCGYHVTQPCESCMDACNNGHFWMFHCTEVSGSERKNPTTSAPLTWSQIPKVQHDTTLLENVKSNLVQR